MKEFLKMFNSKRFLTFMMLFVVYLIGVFFFKTEPMNFALGLSALSTPYIIGQSMRGSKKDEETNNVQ